MRAIARAIRGESQAPKEDHPKEGALGRGKELGKVAARAKPGHATIVGNLATWLETVAAKEAEKAACIAWKNGGRQKKKKSCALL